MAKEKMLRLALVLLVAQQVLGTIIGSLNRTLVEMPAWRHLGPEAWAAFSRLADLGNGRIIYPVAGIGGTLLILATVLVFRLSRRRPLSVAIPLYAAALLAICGVLTTTQAAPIMLSLHRVGNDPQALHQVFEGFYRWDSIRAVLGMVEEFAEIWALVALSFWALQKRTPSQEQETVAP
jgi:hypothetical protein